MIRVRILLEHLNIKYNYIKFKKSAMEKSIHLFQLLFIYVTALWVEPFMAFFALYIRFVRVVYIVRTVAIRLS